MSVIIFNLHDFFSENFEKSMELISTILNSLDFEYIILAVNIT